MRAHVVNETGPERSVALSELQQPGDMILRSLHQANGVYERAIYTHIICP